MKQGRSPKTGCVQSLYWRFSPARQDSNVLIYDDEKNSVEDEQKKDTREEFCLCANALHMYVMFRPQTKLYQQQREKREEKSTLNTNPAFQKTKPFKM
jgi:hypothetical protein